MHYAGRYRAPCKQRPGQAWSWPRTQGSTVQASHHPRLGPWKSEEIVRYCANQFRPTEDLPSTRLRTLVLRWSALGIESAATRMVETLLLNIRIHLVQRRHICGMFGHIWYASEENPGTKPHGAHLGTKDTTHPA